MQKNNSNKILLLRLIESSYDKPAWQGTNVVGSLRNVDFEQAAWRQSKDRHNIWEIVVHMAYWKYRAAKRLQGIRKNFFPYKGKDWFFKPDIISEKEWQKDKSLLKEMHTLLIKSINDFNPANLDKALSNGKIKASALIYGIASHDVYHTGQIQLIKKMYSQKNNYF